MEKISNRSFWIPFILALAVIWISVPMPVQSAGQSQSAAKSLSPIDPVQLDLIFKELKGKQALIEASKELDDATKKTLLAQVDQAIQFTKLAEQFKRQLDDFSKRIQVAPIELKKIQTELNQPLSSSEKWRSQTDKLPTSKLEERLHATEADLAQAKNILNSRKQTLDEHDQLYRKLPEMIERTKKRLDALNKEIESLKVTTASGFAEDTRRLALLAEHAKSQAELAFYEQQLTGHGIISSLLTAELDLADREAAKQDSKVKIWLNLLQERNQAEAAQALEQAEEAKQKATEFPTPIQEQFDTNIALSAKLEALTQEEMHLVKKLEYIETQRKEFEGEFALARERVDLVALNRAVGLALREQRQALPTADMYKKNSLDRQNRMGEIREALIELERQRRDLSDLDAETDRIVSAIPLLSTQEAQHLEAKVREMLVSRRDMNEKLQTENRRVFKILRNLEFAEQQLIDRAEEFAAFLDKHLLWIRSTKPLSLLDLFQTITALGWFVGADNWWQLIQDLKLSFRLRPVLWILGLFVGALFLAGRLWARQDLARIANRINQHQKDSFLLTIRAFVLTAYHAAGWPFLMALLAFQLLNLPLPYLFTQTIAKGTLRAAQMLTILIFSIQFCRPNGLAHVHFSWPKEARLTIRRNLAWLTPVAVILTFFIAGMDVSKKYEPGESLAKVALMVLGLAVSMFTVRVLRFSGGIVSAWIEKNPKSWLVRLRYIWYPMAVGVPLFWVSLVPLGYYYSALEMRYLIRHTMLLVGGLILLNNLALRWLTLARRRLAMQKVLEKQAAQSEVDLAPKAGRESPTADGEVISIQEPEIGLVQIDTQTHTLLRMGFFILVLVGLWATWEPVFPAFGILQEVHLWTYSTVVDGVTKNVPIDLADLLAAILIGGATVIAARNLPGLLEITILSHLPMDYGARYAFTTICRYGIIAIGIILTFGTMGIKWSSIQWLIAALGVGLGFGLQEIVANFICGLIVLFERPFRIGDTVTIGDVSGTVSRIRIRATTIVDWDRKELIVPNKEFITGRLINWSLSDPIIRIIIPVGIAYGSDTELAEKLLLKAAQGNKLVLKQPEPTALFKGFGDNSLNFELRVYVDGINSWIPMLHSLNQAIDREFRKAGITISFPQRDVHLDTSGPLEVRIISQETENRGLKRDEQ
jgi:potassium efflux system protein